MYGAIIGGVASIAGGLIGASAARSRERAAARERKRLQKKLTKLEEDRQDIIDPFAGIQDLSNFISNPFAQLSVATGAAEMKIEEADISLANTLDTMRATGASAGGATALANAALRSKKGVAASIEMQEKQNEDKRAQGQQTMEQRQMSEQQRLQQADVAGKQFVFGQRENREMQQLDRTAAMLGASRQAEAQAASDKTGAMTGMFGSLAGIAGGMAGGQ
jgi:hypothetical protein|tara:strand:+ start:6898 stop:7557 length:660 start_codon:yes stop_codon:yes gene_type:complete